MTAENVACRAQPAPTASFTVVGWGGRVGADWVAFALVGYVVVAVTLVRDFGPLTVPLVSALSLLALLSLLPLLSLVLASEAVRGADVARRSARVATVVTILLGALSLVAVFATGFEDPVAPLVIVPGSLILGIALLRSKGIRAAAGAR